jgi:Domain of unknown function (DUF4145)
MSKSNNVEGRGPRGELLPKAHDGLPDTRYASGLCPRCGKQSSFENKGSTMVTHDGKYVINHDGSRGLSLELDRVTVLICRYCTQGTAVIEERVQEPLQTGQRPTTANVYYRGIHWWPLPEANLSPDIPEEIASAFAEAASTLYAQCPRATVVMARRTLEAVTADKGETQGSLATRLSALAAKGILQPELAEWAREVRVIGNTGAHYDPLSKASLEDARDLMKFLRELLRYLYEMPAELKRRRNP